MDEPFHSGERAVQARAGTAERFARGNSAIRDFLPEQHRQFFAQLPFVVAGGMDADAQPWATALAGTPGFIRSPDPQRLAVAARPEAGDPLAAALTAGAPVALLGIELHTRRRNRANGRVEHAGDRGFTVWVEQSFGNCPKYIQARRLHSVATAPGTVLQAEGLDAPARQSIAAADTFFIASAHPAAASRDRASHGVDVSHRGGNPGFIRVNGDTLSVPDFTGNAYFNTLGNLALYPRAGLLFIDFGSGDLLHLSAAAEIIWDGPELRAFTGAERLLRLHVQHMVRRPAALPLRGDVPQPSPFLAGTGHW